ncbi:MAG: hypothetical protein HY555_04445 [Euryarchaeota archaeon]|nr:hypothetical protein [Euryarchaeota archaeon]
MKLEGIREENKWLWCESYGKTLGQTKGRDSILFTSILRIDVEGHMWHLCRHCYAPLFQARLQPSPSSQPSS